jgi:hypothetical protein
MKIIRRIELSPDIILTGVTSGNISKIIGKTKDSFQQLSAIREQTQIKKLG